MIKTKLITKELTVDFKNKIAIKRKIKELKDQFAHRHYDRIKEMYNILSKIVELKRELGLKFNNFHLTEEDGINLNYSHIRYIFSIEHLSPKSKRLIKERKITDSTVCTMIWKFNFLREPQWQDKLVDFYLQGKMRMSELGEFSREGLQDFLNGKETISLSQRYLISATKTIRSMSSRIRNKEISIKDKRYVEALKRAVKNLEESLK